MSMGFHLACGIELRDAVRAVTLVGDAPQGNRLDDGTQPIRLITWESWDRTSERIPDSVELFRARMPAVAPGS
jgi:hypothetical protein